jgi:urease accessory protein
MFSRWRSGIFSSKALKSVTIVEHIYREPEVPEGARTYGRDTITLGWEDRTHVHGRRRTDGGVEFGTSLPRGTVLRAGDCFLLDGERLVVEVVERPEPVFVIEPRTAPDWALFAYHIGNRHQPVMITERALVCPDVPGVEPLLRQHEMPYVRATLPFTPAATVAGHQH